MGALTENSKLVLIKASQISAGTTINCDEIDMQGYTGVIIFGSLATANAGNFAKVKGSDTSGSGHSDLAGTKNVPANNGNSFSIDIYKPTFRYLITDIIRGGANTVTGDVYALLYGAKEAPVSAQGSTINHESHISPQAGTA